jgi:hypothetical protein
MANEVRLADAHPAPGHTSAIADFKSELFFGLGLQELPVLSLAAAA